MGRHARRILKYELHNLVRSPWLLSLAALLLVITETLFRFGSDPTKIVTSLMNVVLIVVPLIALVLGTIYFYNSREFNELLLAQPMNRTSIYLGKLFGFTGAVSIAFIAGTAVPFFLHGTQLSAYGGKIAALLAVGVCFIVIFTAVAFFAATRYEDRLKGLGTVLVAWFFLTVLYDGIVLLFVFIFQDYPYEPGLVTLVFLNPIDLGRILILLQLDISALMGYTGAVFRKVFGAETGMALSAVAMIVYTLLPVSLGLRAFRKRDF